MARDAAKAGFDDYLERIRRFTRDRLRPNELRLAEEDCVPDDILDEIRDIGLFAISIPEEYGGLEFSMEQQVRVLIEVTQASAVYRHRFSTTIGLGSQPILQYGTDEQRRQYLPPMASGELTAAFALTEPDAGSDAASVQTAATRDGVGYLLNGTKRYITNAPEAGVFVVMARTDPAVQGAKGVSAFIVDAGTPGLEVGASEPMMGQAGSHSTEVYFRDCRVPVSALVGGLEGNGFKTAMRGINHARLHVASTCVGQALRLIEVALAHAVERRQFDQPIAQFQSVQNMLADSRAETYAAQSMVLETARRFDRGEIPVTDIACCKYFASETVGRVADRAVQIHGGAGYMVANEVERLYRDARLFRLYEGTSQIQQMVIARDMIKSVEVGR